MDVMERSGGTGEGPTMSGMRRDVDETQGIGVVEEVGGGLGAGTGTIGIETEIGGDVGVEMTLPEGNEEAGEVCLDSLIE